jgi:hypothetical protein
MSQPIMIAPSSQRCWHTQYSLSSSSSSSSDAGSGGSSVLALDATCGMVDAERDREAVSACAAFRAPPFLFRGGAAAGGVVTAAGAAGASLDAFTLAEGLDCRFGRSVVLGFAGAWPDVSYHTKILS